MWADDDLAFVALQFVSKHGLAQSVVPKLKALLEAKRAAVVGGARA